MTPQKDPNSPITEVCKMPGEEFQKLHEKEKLASLSKEDIKKRRMKKSIQDLVKKVVNA